jgi:methionyl-tRNA formyltransferase
MFINIHASLLPRWRGAAPIQRSIMEMDKETGVSIMKIVPKLDAGPYMIQKKVNINSKDNFLSLSKKLSEVGAKLIIEALSLIKKKETIFTVQNEKYVTYAKKISKSESEIDWNETAQKIISKINGLNPYPGVWFKHKGNRIKILDAEISENLGKKGEVITNDLIIGCQDKSIKINLLQKEGKTVLNAKSFLAGYKIVKGDILF